MEGGGLRENRGSKLDYTRNTLMVQILRKGAGQTQTDHAGI